MVGSADSRTGLIFLGGAVSREPMADEQCDSLTAELCDQTVLQGRDQYIEHVSVANGSGYLFNLASLPLGKVGGTPPSAFVEINFLNVSFLKNLKERMIVVVGKQGDQATIDLQNKIIQEEGGKVRLFFIDAADAAKAELLMKTMNLLDCYSSRDALPQRIDYQKDDKGKWYWSLFIDSEAGQQNANANTQAVFQMLLELQKAAKQTPPISQPPATAEISEKQKSEGPKPGKAVVLTPGKYGNFDSFFYPKGAHVIVAVFDMGLRSQDIGFIEEEQAQLDNKASITILDTSNTNTSYTLWKNLSKLKQEPKGIIDPAQKIRSFAIFEYKNGVLKPHNVDSNGDGKFEIESGISVKPPLYPELKAENDPYMNTSYNLFAKIKKGEVHYPMTVVALNDPFEADLYKTAGKKEEKGIKEILEEQSKKGSVFYVNWSDPENRELAMRYLGIPPLGNAHAYSVWEFSGPPMKHGGYLNWAKNINARGISIIGLVDAASVVIDPYEFRYVDEANVDRYFSEDMVGDYIVVVGNPYVPETQYLMERISEEMRDSGSGHQKQLIIIPQTESITAKGILRDKLGINHYPSQTARAYTVSWNKGKSVHDEYTPHGFEIVHMGNNVWDSVVLGSSENLILVVGDTDKSWDQGIANATGDLRERLVGLMQQNNNLIEIKSSEKKYNATKLVYVSYADVARIFASEIEAFNNLGEKGKKEKLGLYETENAVLYQLLQNKFYPQVFLMVGPKNKRSAMLLDSDNISLPSGWKPDKKPNDLIVENLVPAPTPQPTPTVVTPPQQPQPVPPSQMKDIYEKLGELEKKVSAEKKCAVISDPFTEIKPDMSAWQKFPPKRIILIIGKKGSSTVDEAEEKIVGLIEKCELEDHKFFFIDTTLPHKALREEYDEAEILLKRLLKVFGLDSIPEKRQLLSCKLNEGEKINYICEPFK